MSFSISGNNGGMIVSSDYYLKNKSKTNVGAGIIDSALSNKDYGFSLEDNVEMMVAGKMNGSIPKTEAQITNVNVKKGALTQLKSLISSLSKNTIDPLMQRNALTSYIISNSNPSAIKAEISNNGISGNGNLSINVKQLAQGQSLIFKDLSNNEKLQKGGITFKFGKYKNNTFELNDKVSSLHIDIKENMSLGELGELINQKTKDLKAMLVKQSDGTVSLAIISQKTGSQNSLKITHDGSPELSRFDFNGEENSNIKIARLAKDASFDLNGISMNSSENEINDVFGLNLSFSNVTNGDVQLGTTTSPKGVSDNIYAFVENYNSAIEKINTYNSEAADKDFVGALHKTDIIKSVNDKLSNLFNKTIFNGSSLSEIGISKDHDGKLQFNQNKFSENLKKNPELAFSTMGSSIKSSMSGVEIISAGKSTVGEHILNISRMPRKVEVRGDSISKLINFTKDTHLKISFGRKEIDIPFLKGKMKQEDALTIINDAIRKNEIKGYSASLKQNALVFKSSDYGSLNSISILNDIPEIGMIIQKKSGTDLSGTINGKAFLGDGASFESTLDKSSSGMKINIDPSKALLNIPIKITNNKGFLGELNDTLSNIKFSVDQKIKESKDLLDKTKEKSLISQLNELNKKEKEYYAFFYHQFSGISAALAQMDNTIKMMEMMFESNSKD